MDGMGFRSVDSDLGCVSTALLLRTVFLSFFFKTRCLFSHPCLFINATAPSVSLFYVYCLMNLSLPLSLLLMTVSFVDDDCLFFFLMLNQSVLVMDW